MLKDRCIICISSIDWDFVWQGHQEIMDTYAREGNKVLFIENTGIRTPGISDITRLKKRISNWLKSFKGIRKEKENLFIYSPVILPFPYSRIAAFVNRIIMIPVLKKWMKATGFTNPIIWTFLPTRVSLDLIRNLDNEFSLYYCIADFDYLVRDKRKLNRSERDLLKEIDLVFAQGKVLKDRCLRYNKNVEIFPFGVKKKRFENIDKIKIPEDMESIKGAKIGYVGGLHKHIDYELIEYLASSNPDWSIVLVGPDQVGYGSKKKSKNIVLAGVRDHKDLPGYIKAMDVCIIPYENNKYTQTVYPTKLNEYLIMGKPVVSTAIPEIDEFNRINNDVLTVARSKEDFEAGIKNALMPASSIELEKRTNVALKNTWEKRIENMSDIINSSIEEKNASTSRSWKENFAKIYNVSKKKAIKFITVLVVLYLLIFYSPLIWFLAKPLEISQSPRKVDAILVFGGGVGEAGSPGKDTIERARFSVDLYEEGFANNIIYSSGYTYRYNDAENMKFFALSMGIPSRDIILEQKANSTYENVKYAYAILKKKHFDEVILVTSPYNMLRAALVFKNIAPDVKVVYVPVPNPQFYRREGKVKFEQIRAIMHEYLGILYYVYEGYIKLW